MTLNQTELEVLKRIKNNYRDGPYTWQILKYCKKPNDCISKLISLELLDDSIEQNVFNTTVSQLKKVLKKYGLESTGSKPYLIENVLKNLDILSSEFKNRKVYITERGNSILNNSYKEIDSNYRDYINRCSALLKSLRIDECYKEMCKYNLLQIFPNGMGIDWNKELVQGISIQKKQIYVESLRTSNQIDNNICAIFSILSGESAYDTTRFYNTINNTNLILSEVRYCISKVSTAEELISLKLTEIKNYMFDATLDKGTCTLCGNLDGEIFDIEEAIVGVNCPPLHLGCRCTINGNVDCEMPPTTRFSRNRLTNEGEKIPYIKFKEWIKQ